MASSDIAAPAPYGIKAAVTSAIRALGASIKALLTAIFILGAGIWSSRAMIDTGAYIAAETHGVWKTWPSAGLITSDPYTRARFMKLGNLPVSSEIGAMFEARTDDGGARLHSSCDYQVRGISSTTLWWSVAVFDEDGRLIPNLAERYAFTSDTAAIGPDGSFIISLGRDARPGNWLPTSGAGRLIVVFSVYDTGAGLAADQRGKRAKALPVVVREGCS